MKRMVDISIHGAFTCPICGHSHLVKSHREATSWADTFFGLFGETLPERIEFLCITCGYVSYTLPSDMVGKW